MASAAPAVLLTYDDLDFIPQEREGDRHELFDGELVVTTSPVPLHQRLTIRVVFRFRPIVEASGGEVFAAPIGVLFAPAAVAVPDVVYVSRERLGIVGEKAVEGAPDLILEILSPSTRRRDQTRKKALYERYGVPEYWIVDPRFRTVSAFALREGRYGGLPEAAGVVHSTVVPGFSLDPAVLFAGL